MKSLHNIIALGLLLSAMTGCKKETERIADFTLSDTSTESFIKINYASAYQRNPAVQLKVNDVRVSSTFSYPYPYPGGGLNTGGGSDPLYFPLKAGANKITVNIPKAGTSTDSADVFSASINTEAGKFYTYHIVDTSANTQTLLVEENTVLPDAGTSRFRFVNLIPNLPAIDLYYGTTVVAANVAYKSAGASFVLPTSTTPAAFSIRRAGDPATQAAITSYTSTGVSTYTIPYGRVITVFARGYSTVSGTTDPRRAQLSLYFVR